jgi:hypothetical protein
VSAASRIVAGPQARELIVTGRAAAGLRVSGVLDLSDFGDVASAPLCLPRDLQVEVLDLHGYAGPEPLKLPRGLRAYELILANSHVVRLPDDLRVESRLDLSGCSELSELPEGLAVGTLVLRGCTSLVGLPEGLDAWFLDMTGCWAFAEWPRRAAVHSGRLVLRGCTALTGLPRYLRRLAALDVRDCPNLRGLPAGLEITGWLDVAQSGLKEETALPESLERVQLRWAGINIDRRIAFHPERITAHEALAERNAERRRVLIDRIGYARFLSEARAELLDEDRDPGGRRQLLRLKLEGDEDLVALSCHCPSTQRQYLIRVPPATPSCRHAAAWIAGFDNPDDYQPIHET